MEKQKNKRAPGARVRVADAAFPRPFPFQLEYNCPVHEHWNIVHTGMLIPETHAIYVCSDNCVRGVIMTADEWNAQSRFSAVMPTQRDTIDGNLEQATIDGVSRVIDRLPYRPKAVQVFLVCMHHFLGVDERWIFRELSRRYPDIHFIRCWMDPIMQKVGLTPEQKQRREMMLCLADRPADAGRGVVLGDDYRLPDSSDIVRILARHGIRLYQVQDARTYQEFTDFGDAAFGITRSPLSAYGLQQWARRDGKRWAYLPPAMTYKEIAEELRTLLQTALPERPEADIRAEVEAFSGMEIRETEAAFSRAREQIRDREIRLDAVGCVRPLSTAALLLDHGFRVTTVYADALMKEEEPVFRRLQAEYPDLVLQSTMQAQALVLAGEREKDCPGEPVLAIGPKAAFFSATPHFVNQIESGGNWGFDGIRRMLAAMGEAVRVRKDTEALVTRKGLRQDGSYGYAKQPRPMREVRADQAPRCAAETKLPGQRSFLRRDTYRILPVYAGDVSGVCSALYELGGMIVMHDPSGCNSTYNTHDETRWYHKRSNIFITGLNERDAILGNDRKLIRDIEDAIAVLDDRPEFVTLCNSPVPYLIGTDFVAICRRVEQDTGIPCFYVRTNGMHDYIRGEQEAFLAFAKKMLPRRGLPASHPRVTTGTEEKRPPVSTPPRVAVLGMTPLDYGNEANAGSLDRLLTEAGFSVVSHWSMDTSFADAERIPDADAILVVSASGIPAAEYLRDTCGIPFVAGAPVGAFGRECLGELGRAAAGKSHRELCFHRDARENIPGAGACRAVEQTAATLYVIGEPVLMGSLGRALEKASGGIMRTKEICPLEGCDRILDAAGGDISLRGEEEIMDFFAARSAAGERYLVAADPMFRVILPQGVPLITIPTLGYSGREYRKDFPDYFDPAWMKTILQTAKENAEWV